MVMAIEAKLEQFQGQLADARRQYEAIEQQRQAAITGINEIVGAIKGGNQMINDELVEAGATFEDYLQTKADWLSDNPVEVPLTLVKPDTPATPEEGQTDETIS